MARRKHERGHRTAAKTTAELNRSVFNRHVVQRIHYLHRLALANPAESWQYNREMWELANYQKVRLDPSVKHTFCKHCFQSLGTGTFSVIDGSLQVQCSKCGRTRKIKKLQK